MQFADGVVCERGVLFDFALMPTEYHRLLCELGATEVCVVDSGGAPMVLAPGLAIVSCGRSEGWEP